MRRKGGEVATGKREDAGGRHRHFDAFEGQRYSVRRGLSHCSEERPICSRISGDIGEVLRGKVPRPEWAILVARKEVGELPDGDQSVETSAAQVTVSQSVEDFALVQGRPSVSKRTM